MLFIFWSVFLKNEKKNIHRHDTVLYSKNENFGFSILETLSNSLPVLTMQMFLGVQ